MTSADRASRVVANAPAEEVLAQFSPDGRWVAYQTNESGRFDVVVQPFPDAGGKWQVSTAGGVTPRWRADGKKLYYLAPDATLMAVPVTATGTSFEAGTLEPWPEENSRRRHFVLDTFSSRGGAQSAVART